MLSEEKTVNRTNTKTHSKPHKKMKDSSKKGPWNLMKNIPVDIDLVNKKPWWTWCFVALMAARRTFPFFAVGDYERQTSHGLRFQFPPKSEMADVRVIKTQPSTSHFHGSFFTTPPPPIAHHLASKSFTWFYYVSSFYLTTSPLISAELLQFFASRLAKRFFVLPSITEFLWMSLH